MANDTFMMNVPENFDVQTMAEKLAETYRAKGFTVNVMNMNGNVRVQFDKGCGGINMLLGMGQGITANCCVQGSSLVVNYSDAEWTGKIIGLLVGWFLCLVPFITAIIGSINQMSLPKNINNDIMMLANQ